MIKKPYLYWSVAQAILALFVTGLGIAAVMLDCKFSDSAVPLWSGVWFLMAGLLGISGSRNTYNTCVVGGHLVFCVIGIMYAINMTVLFATAAAEEEDVVESGASLEARTAIDICLAVTGITHVVLAVRCLAFASKVCCNGNDFSQRQRRPNSRPREVEVTGRNMEADVPQTPSAVMEPPSYAYINTTAPQSFGIRFANGSYPPAPPYADQPPSYSEVTSGARTPTSLQINISYAPPASEPVTGTTGADVQASGPQIGQDSQTATTATEDAPTDAPITQCIQVECAPATHETENQDLESQDGQSSQSGGSVANETRPQQLQENQD